MVFLPQADEVRHQMGGPDFVVLGAPAKIVAVFFAGKWSRSSPEWRPSSARPVVSCSATLVCYTL
jgi:hypothetical protein